MEHSKARVWVTYVYSGTMNDCGSSFPLFNGYYEKMAWSISQYIDTEVEQSWVRNLYICLFLKRRKEICLLEWISATAYLNIYLVQRVAWQCDQKLAAQDFIFQYLSYYSLHSAYVFFRLRTEESMHSKVTSSFHIYSPNVSEDLWHSPPTPWFCLIFQ